MPDHLAAERALVDSLVAENAETWDLAGRIPAEVLRELGTAGLLCAQVPTAHGGRGLTSADNGEFTAHVGSRCSSLRSVMTSQGMAAWTVQRFGDRSQRDTLLAQLTSGHLAAVGFSEPEAGSDLSAIRTEIRAEGDTVVVTGHKVWMTAACYADLLIVVGRFDGGAAAVVVPSSADGVRVRKVADPLGCRAAGHAEVELDEVRLPASSVLGGVGQSLPLLLTTALAYGRFSVAWGCVGILRACLASAAAHAANRQQSGVPLAGHQLVARHLAELVADERTAALACERASRCWDEASPDLVVATVLAKHVSARNAARGAATAVQVLASAGARDGHVVARAYRDAKLMELIEGSNEICQLLLAEHAVAGASR
ncbi:acyl-CoA dehydrogenase family protein [Saccharomonospora xinjiangensis]|uniref:acyl-CoA dehydrogenase family protein n=1 Tax=Saccharomonospora xinjiangensis TaxID=75294 RepID=UPI003510110E